MRAFSIVLAALPLSVAVNTYGQSSNRLLEEIVITATKRETTLQDTAMAVSAFSGSMLDDLNIRGPMDLETIVPSLTFQEFPNRVSIRGVGRFSNSLGVSPGVAIYTDGIYSAEAAGVSHQPINVQRTEVLRGPQGTLYGRNTTGGAINVLTKRPTEELEADLRVRVGDYGYQQLAALVTGPITDSLRYKLYALDTERDGLQDNVAGKDVRTLNETYYEAQLDWDATERLNFWFKYATTKPDYIPGDSVSNDPYDCVNNWSGLGQAVQYKECQEGRENVSIGDPQKVALNDPGKIKQTNTDYWTASASYEFDQAALRYLYGSIQYDWNQKGVDYDGTMNDFSVQLSVGQYQEQESHELQLTSNWDKDWNYLIGFFYFDDKNEQPYRIHNDGYAPIQTITSTDFLQRWDNPLEIIYFQRALVETESWAVYGEVDYAFNDQWGLVLGARYSDDKLKGKESQIQYYDLLREGLPLGYDASQSFFANDPNRYTDTWDASYDDDYTNLTGKISLNYRPEPGELYWATISNGYKMGGVRLGALEKFYAEAAGENDDGKFDQEDLVMFELGWRGELLDGKLRTEAVAFNYSYDGMQQLRSFQTPPPGNITLDQVVNADSEMYGFELSATYLPTDRISMLLTYSYNHAEISEDVFFRDRTFGQRDADGNIIPDNINGKKLQLTPENKAALATHYTLPSEIGEFSFGGTFSYMGKRYFDLNNYVSEDSYTRLDLQASWTSNSGRYAIQATMNNATDAEAYNTQGCSAAANGVYGTDSWIIRCSGDPLNQRTYAAEFIVRL